MSTPSIPMNAYKYESIPNAIKSSSKTSRFQPTNGSSFTSNSNNVIRLEIKSDGYLTNECYLKFAITNNSDNNGHLDAYATAIINRLRLLCNGTVLSDIQAYHVLSNILIASQSSDDFQRVLQTTAGASQVAGDDLTGAHDTGSATTALNNAQAFGFNALAPTGNATGVNKKYYSIPIVSGFINSSRFIPLGLLAGSGLVLEIYLESSYTTVFNSPAAFAGALTYTVSECEFIAKIVTIEDEKADMMIKQMWQSQGLKIKCDDWTTHFNTIQSGVQSATLNIPDRSACLKSLTTVMCHSAPTHIISALQSYKFHNSAYQYRIGSVLYPNQEVSVSDTNLVESMSEHLKSLNTGIFNLNSSTYIKPSTWGNNIGYTKMGTYAMTYDFEAYSESPDLFSGIDTATLGLPITLNCKFSANTPVVINAITFAHKDVVYNINPDGTITKYE